MILDVGSLLSKIDLKVNKSANNNIKQVDISMMLEVSPCSDLKFAIQHNYTRCHFFCLDTKEMTKEKVKTVEKYGLGEIIKTHANACDNFRPPAGSLRCTE